MTGLRVAVLGGNNGGDAAAADLALAGHHVRFWRRSAAEFEAVLRTGWIRFEGDGVSGEAALDRATTDVKEALAPTTTRRGRPRGFTASAPSRSWSGAGSGNEPLTFAHRDVSEDVELGLALFVSLAEASRTAAPVGPGSSPSSRRGSGGTSDRARAPQSGWGSRGSGARSFAPC